MRTADRLKRLLVADEKERLVWLGMTAETWVICDRDKARSVVSGS
ncbi:MAG: hypothetical protein AAFP07_09800 [Cyanobacteria bacterium J06606_4]